MAASDGHLSTKVACGLYGNEWRITSTGLKHLERLLSWDAE